MDWLAIIEGFGLFATPICVLVWAVFRFFASRYVTTSETADKEAKAESKELKDMMTEFVLKFEKLSGQLALVIEMTNSKMSTFDGKITDIDSEMDIMRKRSHEYGNVLTKLNMTTESHEKRIEKLEFHYDNIRVTKTVRKK